MTTFLIDSENVSLKMSIPVMGIKKHDTVHFFFSACGSKPSYDDLYELERLKVKTKLHKATVGAHNALDVQLASYLGFRLRFNLLNEKFCIVSNDKAFMCLKTYWQERGKNIEVVSPGDGKEKPATSENIITLDDKVKIMPSASTRLNTELKNHVKNPKVRRVVTAYILNPKHSRVDINTFLTKQYQGQELRNINNIIAPYVKGR